MEDSQRAELSGVLAAEVPAGNSAYIIKHLDSTFFRLSTCVSCGSRILHFSAVLCFGQVKCFKKAKEGVRTSFGPFLRSNRR